MTYVYLTFIFYFFSLSSSTWKHWPTANRTAEKKMHAVDARFWPLPLTKTQNDDVEPTQQNERSD